MDRLANELFMECISCGNERKIYGEHVNVGRVLDRLDELLAQDDMMRAEKHLEYWLREAEMKRDVRGKFLLYNEMIGFYRKKGDKEKALFYVARALEARMHQEIKGSSAEATALINAATAYVRFDMAKEAMPLFEQAKAMYEKNIKDPDDRVGGLYNNMALCCMALGRYDEALVLDQMALAVMEQIPGSEPEQAVTLLNMADAVNEKANGEEEELEAALQTEEYLTKALSLLNKPGISHDSNYRYVCQKCAPVFEAYGWFDDAKQLISRGQT